MSDLPKPGEVWGVPDKPTTWMLITGESDKFIHVEFFGDADEGFYSPDEWHESNVRIIPKETP